MNKVFGNTAIIWTASTAQALGLESAVHLSEEEIALSRRLKQVDDRDRFLGARALLRHALSETLNGEIDPEAWAYREGPNGKPVMAPELPQVEFNISHAGDCVAVGVSTSGPIGVDIECAVPDDRLEIVSDALSEREFEHLNQQMDELKWETFLQFWTIKEACAKALGIGAALDFRELEVAFNPPRVVAPKGLLGTSEAFIIESRSILVDQCPYCLSIAKITKATGETLFCFKPPTNDHVAQSDDTEIGKVSGH